MDLGKLARRGQQYLRGFGELVVVAQKVRPCEKISWVAACIRWHGLEQLLRIASLTVERNASLRDREVGGPQPPRGPQRSFVVQGKKSLLHAGLVIGATQELGIALEHLFLDIGRQRIVVPRLAHERARAFSIALREQRPRQHKSAHARLRRRAIKEAQRLRRFDILNPKHRFCATAENCEAWPARIGGNKIEIPLAACAVMIAAQDEPLDEFARCRLRYGFRDDGRLAGPRAAQRIDRALD